ncbi:hypothetical protein D3C75_1193740 [compost metagenome]
MARMISCSKDMPVERINGLPRLAALAIKYGLHRSAEAIFSAATSNCARTSTLGSSQGVQR